jgi:hypothetical protein
MPSFDTSTAICSEHWVIRRVTGFASARVGTSPCVLLPACDVRCWTCQHGMFTRRVADAQTDASSWLGNEGIRVHQSRRRTHDVAVASSNAGWLVQDWGHSGQLLRSEKLLTVSPNYAAEMADSPSKGVELDDIIRCCWLHARKLLCWSLVRHNVTTAQGLQTRGLALMAQGCWWCGGHCQWHGHHRVSCPLVSLLTPRQHTTQTMLQNNV